MDDALTTDEKAAIRATSLADVVRRNTGVTSIQDQAFMAPPKDQWMDSDHDGRADIREVIAGTDPTDPRSRLQTESITLSAATESIVLEWQSVPGISYLIERTASLDSTWEPLQTLTADATTATWTAPLTELSQSTFYRVVVSQ